MNSRSIPTPAISDVLSRSVRIRGAILLFPGRDVNSRSIPTPAFLDVLYEPRLGLSFDARDTKESLLDFHAILST